MISHSQNNSNEEIGKYTVPNYIIYTSAFWTTCPSSGVDNNIMKLFILATSIVTS